MCPITYRIGLYGFGKIENKNKQTTKKDTHTHLPTGNNCLYVEFPTFHIRLHFQSINTFCVVDLNEFKRDHRNPNRMPLVPGFKLVTVFLVNCFSNKKTQLLRQLFGFINAGRTLYSQIPCFLLVDLNIIAFALHRPSF